MALNDNLRILRIQMGISQDGLAARLGVSRQSVSKWETGTATPELDKLTAMAELFGVTLDELVLGDCGGAGGGEARPGAASRSGWPCSAQAPWPCLYSCCSEPACSPLSWPRR